MNIKNCMYCGKIYVFQGYDYCPACLVEMDNLFVIVRDYIYTNPPAPAAKVAEETEVDEAIILKFLREGRLELKDPSVGLPCEMCGVAIRSGRYCPDCARSMEEGLKDGLMPTPQFQKKRAEESRMFLDRHFKSK